MRKIVFGLVILAASILTSTLSSDAQDLKANIAGKSVTRTNKEGQTYTTTYRRDGTTFSKSTRLDGTCCMTSPGHWWVQGGLVCESYANWRGGSTFCH